MCHHYIAGRTRSAAGRAIVHRWDDEFSIRSNQYQLVLPDAGFYPLDRAPIVRLDGAGERELAGAEWGFLPAWWKPSDKTPKRATFQRKCFNARSEEVDVKPTYRSAFRRQRCLMPAEEFFEKGHYFRLTGDEPRPFAFAGLWDRWEGGDGELVESCTLLTTEANEIVAGVGHPRMPVVLRSEAEYGAWLDPERVERGALEALLRPTPAEIWECRAATGERDGSASAGGGERNRMLF
jgi:putative SOS response-associated peptidase YedK